MLAHPGIFREPGDAGQYLEVITAWIAYLHHAIAANPASPAWQSLRDAVARNAQFHMAYSTSDNLKPLMSLRARFIEQALTARGCPLDWQFAPRPAGRKIKLGILAANFKPGSETFATLPVYRHIDRSLFDIVLFSADSIEHPLEQFCADSADQFICLPKEVPDRIPIIRDADLDMLYIGTNVTSLPSGMAALAAHRLARMQVAGVCSCVTTGMRNVDYYLSGTMSEPPKNAQEQYTEKLLLMDGPAHCYDFGTEGVNEPARPLARPDVGLSDDAIVYASGANFYRDSAGAR